MSSPAPRTVLHPAQASSANAWASRGATNLMGVSSSRELADVDEVAVHGRGSGHGGTDQVGAAARTLAALEIPIAGGGAALTRVQPVGVHRQAHRAARLAPL